jgi:hypothetical protein
MEKDVLESKITRKEFLRRTATGADAVALFAVDKLARLTAKRFAIAVMVLFWLFALFVGSALASEADALAISQNIRARHMPFGIIVDPVFAAPDSEQIVSYTHCGDSAIWTGHYLAAEAFRYSVTRSGDALNNVKAALSGIAAMLNVTGTNLLARCLIPMNSPYAQAITQEEAHNGIFQNTQFGYYWIGNTSRDQYSGVFFGLEVAYDLVDDPEVRARIASLTTLLLDFLRGHNWSVRMPNGSISTTFIGRADQQLSLLQVGRHVNAARFSRTYDLYRFFFSPLVIVPISFEVLDNNSYFKFNLDSINLFNLIRLESSSFKGIYRQAYDILRRHTDNHKNAFFNMIDRALSGPNDARDADTRELLDEWLLRPRRDQAIDLRGVYPACGSPDQACVPVPIVDRPRTDFLWQRNPFLLVGQGSGTIETAGIDYILPYWMGRYYGTIF